MSTEIDPSKRARWHKASEDLCDSQVFMEAREFAGDSILHIAARRSSSPSSQRVTLGPTHREWIPPSLAMASRVLFGREPG